MDDGNESPAQSDLKKIRDFGIAGRKEWEELIEEGHGFVRPIRPKAAAK
jgi:hypothetical protein